MTQSSSDALENYLPFRLYTESRNGATVAQLAAKYEIAPLWIEERIAAARLCFDQQIRIVRVENRVENHG